MGLHYEAVDYNDPLTLLLEHARHHAPHFARRSDHRCTHLTFLPLLSDLKVR